MLATFWFWLPSLRENRLHLGEIWLSQGAKKRHMFREIYELISNKQSGGERGQALRQNRLYYGERGLSQGLKSGIFLGKFFS